jgi:hypothetical protein
MGSWQPLEPSDEHFGRYETQFKLKILSSAVFKFFFWVSVSMFDLIQKQNTTLNK